MGEAALDIYILPSCSHNCVRMPPSFRQGGHIWTLNSLPCLKGGVSHRLTGGYSSSVRYSPIEILLKWEYTFPFPARMPKHENTIYIKFYNDQNQLCKGNGNYADISHKTGCFYFFVNFGQKKQKPHCYAVLRRLPKI